MIVLTVSEVIGIHEKLIAKTGGLGGVRDFGLLESAVLNCAQTFSGEELYPTVQEKAANMAYGLCKNHAFSDGNKRTAMLAMIVMLELGGVTVEYTQRELVDLGLDVAEGKLDGQGITEWINRHTQ
jgi:death-on-curing protein